jgi:hypothetical protein
MKVPLEGCGPAGLLVVFADVDHDLTIAAIHSRPFGPSELCKVPYVTERYFGIVEVRTIIKRGAVILLHPAILHPKFIQQRHRA